MAFQRPVDEWRLVVQRQSQLNKAREEEERQRQLQEKVLYKKDLEYQYHLKELERESIKKQRDSEAVAIQQRASLFHQQDALRKHQETQLKKQFAQDYQMQSSYLKQKQQQEKESKFREEQEHLNRLKQQAAREDQLRKDERLRLQQEQKLVQNYLSHQQAQRSQKKFTEQQLDNERAQRLRAQEERKEQQYKEYYKQLDAEQRTQVARFSQLVSSKNQRETQISAWIDHNCHQQQQLLARKEDIERQQRESNTRDMHLSLQQQIAEKQRQREFSRKEHQDEAVHMQHLAQHNRHVEQQREAQRKREQAAYRQLLDSQSLLNQDAKAAAYKLTDFEKKANTMETHSPIQRSGAAVLRSSQSLSKSFW